MGSRKASSWFTATVICLLAATALVAAPNAIAQQIPELPQPSSKASVGQRVGLTDFTIEYFSPGVKNRTIWGGLVPYGELWRTGANAPTTLEASRDFSFGGTAVPAGKYSVLSIPGEKGWTVILNKNLKLRGTIGYDAKDDAARIGVVPAAVRPRERMAFIFSETTDDSTRLDLEWGTVLVSVPITVDTAAHTSASIDSALDEAWRPHFASARYLLDNGGNLPQALEYVETSIAIKATWWNNWVKAQILAKQGSTKDAIAAAEQAQKLGGDDPIYSGFFAETIGKSIATWKDAS